MTDQGYTLFDTAIGRCALGWNRQGVVALQLPEPSDAATRARLRRRHPGLEQASPPPAIEQAIAAIVALLEGKPSDLSFVALDMTPVPAFNRRVYEIARRIPPGRTRTYGEIAIELGDRALARDVGQALGQNPFAIIVPCHRVMGANGKLTGFSANGGIETKLRMLGIEGAQIGSTPTLFESLPAMAKPARAPARRH
ncbi:MAG TPA: methylated-DNA--[protein]-cysteine S-methyltransferase [Hypericibacter adhaerens]|jgi:methylated-DNA-[protein]-cysteine S-methyltransferase|uniref:Methylated-DNA--protein-cysteine methyltransferase n=1 Tax=Hypericibacter adhaerens TaxID=2602016 RepID=A0A5J6N4R7_9PROT|nr:methylated-DNA--[protein]-cysteine S-methyltransferase [Hypericibacter adhaerens]QEX24424.1 methylated-DNA--protein-cysteine methyltransferase [Hypericibacter adhaerens]HWA46228.1 methylated-DNA--[protein]-cysteine S-methyltransferase [Hypericibacter adhaerens]